MPNNLTLAERAARLLHYRAQELGLGDPLVPPMVSASSFHLPGADAIEKSDYAYGRFSTPIWEAVEKQLSILEDAPAIAFPSGMAAITACFISWLKAGDRVMIPSDGYHATRHFADRYLNAMGIDVVAVPTPQKEDLDFKDVAMVLVETPSNPRLDVCDLEKLIARAHAAGALVVVDNSTMTPFLQRPLDLGADAVVAADTKAPGGHSDLLFGHVATRDAALLEQIFLWRKLSGSIPGAHDAWLLHRGLETLEVRLARMCETAGLVSTRLQAHARVKNVRYPGLTDDPSYAIAKKQMDGFGFLIGFELESADHAEAFLSACSLLAQSTSFGGVHSSAERRARWGDCVPEGFIRMSIGVEPAEVLWDAIDQALG